MQRDITTIPPVPANQRVKYGSEASQFFDVFRPSDGEGSGTALMIHGGYWRARYNLEHASHMCAALAREGIATASLEYRRVGEKGGGWPGTWEDVKAGFAAARKQLREAPVVLGHSAGGHLALLLATAMADMKGVVALAPVADLQMAYQLHLSNDAVVELLGGTPAQKPAVYYAADPTKHASSVPRIVLHGTADDVVPISLSQSFVRSRKDDRGKVELLEVPGANHFDLIDPQSAAWSHVLSAVRKLEG